MLRALTMAALIVLTGSSCSEGGLDDLHDPYLAVFGIPKADAPAAKGAFLGRVLREGGRPGAWAQIYARREEGGAGSSWAPVETIANAKGGFLLPALEPGNWRLIATTPAGEGMVRDVVVTPGNVVEERSMELSALRRVTGHVRLENEPVATGVLVYVPGTPFSSFTDHEGFFSLNLPAGAFRIRAEKDMFQPQEFSELALSGDAALEMTLSENPWPAGQISVKDAEGGVVVRTLTPTLLLAPVPGVKYMRFISWPMLRDPEVSVALRRWQPLKTEIELPLIEEGFASVLVEFRDAYGKTSDPVEVSFLATELDASWIILYGHILQPVTFSAGQKVALFGSNTMSGNASIRISSTTGAVSAPAPASASVEPTPHPGTGGDEPAPTTPAGDSPGLRLVMSPGGMRPEDDDIRADPASNWYGATTFEGAVTVEAGVTIRGGATFAGPLVVAGTKEAPVVFQNIVEDGRMAQIRVSSASASLDWFQAKNVSFDLGAWGGQAVSMRNATLERSRVHQVADETYVADVTRTTTELVIDRVHASESVIEQACLRQGGYDAMPAEPGSEPGSGSAGSGGSEDSDETVIHRDGTLIVASFVLSRSVLEVTPIVLGCQRSTDHDIEAVHILLRGNAFTRPPTSPDDPYVFGLFGAERRALPALDAATYSPEPNFIAMPSRLPANTDDATLRAIFGEPLTSAPADVGPR